MNILLIGYGKMGKTIESIALKRGHTIIGKIDADNLNSLHQYSKDNVDVAIEFSSPESAFANIKYCIENGISIVSGTTGWLDKKAEIESLCTSKKGTFFYASNYSIGVNLFFELNSKLAALMSSQKDYKLQIEEIHHTEKKDAPSGTAISIADGIIQNHDSFNTWALDSLEKGVVPIKAIRTDNVPGTHTVLYSSPIDDIEIKHTAHSRDGFALGAVMVAEWLQNKVGILSMRDFLKELNK
jgi:4-hydroxy-tetrahydrodipicolinate reductase